MKNRAVSGCGLHIGFPLRSVFAETFQVRNGSLEVTVGGSRTTLEQRPLHAERGRDEIRGSRMIQGRRVEVGRLGRTLTQARKKHLSRVIRVNTSSRQCEPGHPVPGAPLARRERGLPFGLRRADLRRITANLRPELLETEPLTGIPFSGSQNHHDGENP